MGRHQWKCPDCSRTVPKKLDKCFGCGAPRPSEEGVTQSVEPRRQAEITSEEARGRATQTFKKVWYIPDERTWGGRLALSVRDKGKLVVREDSLEFEGRKQRVLITNVRHMSFGKLVPQDFVNNWVRVEYGDDPTPSRCYLAEGSAFGWGGLLGRTKRLLAAMQHLCEPEPVEETGATAEEVGGREEGG